MLVSARFLLGAPGRSCPRRNRTALGVHEMGRWHGRLRTGATIGGLLLCGMSGTRAQGPMPPAAALQAMKQLDWLVGRWKGEAVIEYQPGQRRTINQTETVQSKLSGLVLLVEGVGTIRTPGEEREIPVFEALAVVSYDDQAKRYRWQ